MTEQEKIAQAEAETKAKADADAKAKADAEFQASLDGLSDEEKTKKIAEREGKPLEKKIDYDAELKKEREARLKAEKIAAEKDFREREQRRKAKEEGSAPEVDGEKPLTRTELLRILSEKDAQQKKDKALEIAKKMTGSDAEAELVAEVFNNRTFPSHLSLEDQVKESYVIANAPRFLAERNEALRALKAGDMENRGAALSHPDGMKAAEPTLAAPDLQAIKSVGYIWNSNTRLYEKKLPNKKLLTYDPKTKQTRLLELGK